MAARRAECRWKRRQLAIEARQRAGGFSVYALFMLGGMK
jgi:hypothetical protein